MSKLSNAQVSMLRRAPDDWAMVPTFGDHRPAAPLLRNGMIEERRTDVTPIEWGSGSVTVVRIEWRITDAGRLALAESQRK